MSYTPGTTPRNFEEFLECYENELIVRRLFPKKDIGIGKGDIYIKELLVVMVKLKNAANIGRFVSRTDIELLNSINLTIPMQ